MIVNGKYGPLLRKILDSGVSSFEEFESLLERQYPGVGRNAKLKGYIFETFVEAFLHLDYDEVYSVSDVPAQLRTQKAFKVILERIDGENSIGIDGVIVDKSKPIPYQVKYRNYENTKALTLTDCATFYAVDGFSQRVVITNTDGLNTIAKGFKQGAWVISRRDFYELTPEDFDRIRSLVNNNVVVPFKPFTRRPHQIEAITEINNAIANGVSRGKVIMYCGTGKTEVFTWAIADNDPNHVVLFFPNLDLVSQTYKRMKKTLGKVFMNKYETLFVCSDQSVGKDDDDLQDVYDYNLPVTTDPKEVRRFYKKSKSKKTLTLGTYHSSHIIARGSKNVVTFDMGIYDEAHRTVGRKQSAFNYCVHNKNIAIDHRLFFTATPKHLKDADGGGSHCELVSMDDTKLYGETLYSLSQKQAIERKLIVPVKVIVTVINENDDVLSRNMLKKSETSFNNESIRSEELSIALAYADAKKKYGFTHSIGFEPSIKSSKNFRATLDLVTDGKCRAFHIDCNDNTAKRYSTQLEFVNSEWGYIGNVNIYSEGKDAPKADSAVFRTKSKSVSSTQQRIGRIQRLSADGSNKNAYVFVPIYVQKDETVEEAIQNTGFSTFWQVLMSAMESDEALIDVIHANIEDQRTGAKPRGSLIRMLKDAGVIFENIELDLLVAAIETKIIDMVPFLPFEKARKFAQSLGLKNRTEWVEYTKSGNKPSNVPAYPRDTHKNEFKGWGDWLGTGNVRSKEFQSFNAARKFVQSLGLKNKKEWVEFYKSGNTSSDIPAAPGQVYKGKGWLGWGDWLGTGTVANQNKEFRSFNAARKFIRSLGLKSVTEWVEFYKSGNKPSDIPAGPARTYKDTGWAGMGDWLGNK